MERLNMTLLENFLNDTTSPADFDHQSHVEVSFELLNRCSFDEAYATYVRQLRALTVRAGAEEKFNATITFAALSIIAERMSELGTSDWNEFIANNPDLLRAATFTAGYSKERLSSDTARSIPLLPDVLTT